MDATEESRPTDEAPEEGEESADRNLDGTDARLRLDRSGALEEVADVLDLDRRREGSALLDGGRDRPLVDRRVEVAEGRELSDE